MYFAHTSYLWINIDGHSAVVVMVEIMVEVGDKGRVRLMLAKHHQDPNITYFWRIVYLLK